MEKWIEGNLGDLCEIKIGGTPSRDNSMFWDADKNTSNFWVSIRDLNRKTINSTAERISNLGVLHSNTKKIEAGTVLLSFKLSIGRVAFAGVDLYTNEAIAALCNSQIDSQFLYYGLQHWNLLEGVDVAIKGATLNKSKLKKIKVYYPENLSEQRRIAEILGTVDAEIEQTEALLAKYQRLKTGLLAELLTHGLDAQGQRRSPQTHEYKTVDGVTMPVEWEVQRISSILKSKDYGISVPLDDEEGIPVLRMNNLVNGEIRFSGLKKSNSFEAKFKLLKQGDVLFNRTNSIDYVGRTAVFRGYHTEVSFASYLVRLVTNERMTPEFLNLWLNLKKNHIYVKTMATVAVQQANINASNLAKLSIAFPNSIEEQSLIVNASHAFDQALVSENNRLQKLQALKKGLMQKLLSGPEAENEG